MRLPRPIHFQAILIWQDLIFTEVFWKGIEAMCILGLQYTVSTVWIFMRHTPHKKTHTYTYMYVCRKEEGWKG
jgi:hypothetical protein